jgi:predicted ATP-grasp superfamily ATP-dependent carboligase
MFSKNITISMLCDVVERSLNFMSEQPQHMLASKKSSCKTKKLRLPSLCETIELISQFIITECLSVLLNHNHS